MLGALVAVSDIVDLEAVEKGMALPAGFEA